MNGKSENRPSRDFVNLVHETQLNGHLMEDAYEYEFIEAIATWLLKRTKVRPVIGIIAGSGLGGLASQLKPYPDNHQDKDQDNNQINEFEYSKIPGFPKSTVEGHDGKLIFGYINNIPALCMKGRFHPFEGYPLWKCAMPVRVMKLLGCKMLLVTNAAGGVNAAYKVGDIMIIKDHINIPGFSGNNPLKGKNDPRWGTRFPPMNQAYDRNLRAIVKSCAVNLKIDNFFKEGVYCMFGGPMYETVAEIKMIRILGGDAVGMSTIHEVITAVHCGMKVIGLSLITNECIADENSIKQPNHEEVIAVSAARAKDMEALVQLLVKQLSDQGLL